MNIVTLKRVDMSQTWQGSRGSITIIIAIQKPQIWILL